MQENSQNIIATELENTEQCSAPKRYRGEVECSSSKVFSAGFDRWIQGMSSVLQLNYQFQ